MFPAWSSAENHINGFNINQKKHTHTHTTVPHRHRMCVSSFGISLHRDTKAQFVYYRVCFFRGKWELCHIQRSASATAYSVWEYIAFLDKHLFVFSCCVVIDFSFLANYSPNSSSVKNKQQTYILEQRAKRNKLAVIRDYILPNFLSQFCFSVPVHYPYCHLTDV